ncbi:DUF397 domain-containing protein [Streptomyces regalis]|uniref:Toxin n=1 Tax=Streptomyces regalis TaxID=68262 RepID=A0A117MNL3_9ACTN|nr:DUF397 domain-containing protein [Streptomyces regalis]KUL27222.1 toxin [Streptomyces regalis]
MRNTPDDDLSTATWHKSSYSQGGDNCLEVARWRKSTYSQGGGDCLEVADGHPTVVPVRDSKNPHGPKLIFRASAWAAFVEAVRI